MATDTSRLQGEVVETVPVIEPTNVENLLKGFLQALMDEAQLSNQSAKNTGEAQ